MTLRKVLDRLTPSSLRVYYGADRAAKYGNGGGWEFSWGCNRCLRTRRYRRRTGFTLTLAEARAEGKRHRRRRGHFGMRVVYEPEG